MFYDSELHILATLSGCHLFMSGLIWEGETSVAKWQIVVLLHTFQVCRASLKHTICLRYLPWGLTNLICIFTDLTFSVKFSLLTWLTTTNSHACPTLTITRNLPCFPIFFSITSNIPCHLNIIHFFGMSPQTWRR